MDDGLADCWIQMGIFVRLLPLPLGFPELMALDLPAMEEHRLGRPVKEAVIRDGLVVHLNEQDGGVAIASRHGQDGAEEGATAFRVEELLATRN